jgi:hypothetical protein
MGAGSLRSPLGKSAAGERLGSRLSVRLTLSEWARVQAAAGALGISANRLVRDRLLERPLPPARPAYTPISDINRAAYRQLGAIGNNLNQLARHFSLNVVQGDPEAIEVLAELQYVIPLVREVQRLLRGAE